MGEQLHDAIVTGATTIETTRLTYQGLPAYSSKV